MNCFLNTSLTNYFDTLPPSEGRVCSWETPLKGFSLQSLIRGETHTARTQRCLHTASTFNEIITPSCLYNGYWLSIFAA